MVIVLHVYLKKRREIFVKTKIDIISGFLGAGKTTLIKEIINHGFYDNKVVIIENEFGEVGIDGELIKLKKI